MRWPWQRQQSSLQLVASWCGQRFCYVLARLQVDGVFAVIQLGVLSRDADSHEDFVRKLQGLGLKGLQARFMLRPEQYQLLQIDAPAVLPEELRSAARYQIKEMLDHHIDDVTLDVMQVGDGQHNGAGHLFVVAATNEVLRGVLGLGEALRLTVGVIDIQETAQRNLQNALVAQKGTAQSANAALVLVEGQQAVLTISANDELFYSRRFDLPEDFLTASWGGRSSAASGGGAYVPIDEYVPDYSVGGVSYGNDYTGTPAAPPVNTASNPADEERAQRFLVEVQRSLDVWDRSWSGMPLNGLRVYAGDRSGELSNWLSLQLGTSVSPLDVSALFAGFEQGSAEERALCFPLLGVLMRTESRKL